MKSILVSEKLWSGHTQSFNDKLNKALDLIEQEGGIIREKKYVCRTVIGKEDYLWHNVILFYDIIPTRTVITEKVGG